MASSGLPGCRKLLLGPLGCLVRVIRPCNLRLPKKTNCVLTALLQLGGKLSLLQQGPAAAHPNQKSGRLGRSVADTDGKRNQAAPPRPLITASSQQAWPTTHCTRLPKTCTGADRGGQLSSPLTNPAQLYFKLQVKLTHVTTTVQHADYLPAWA